MLNLQINLGDAQTNWLKNSKQLGHLIRMVLDSLVDVDLAYIKTHKVPCIYESGVRYEEEPANTVEEFAAIPVVLSRGWGDCDDLACWRVAELRAHGEPAYPRIEWRRFPATAGKPAGRLYHVVVRRARFTMDDPRSIEDPSALLGMNEPRHTGLINAIRNRLLSGR